MTENVTKEMTLGEVITKFPQTAEIMLKYGLHCVGCHVATSETIEQGAMAHGLDEEKIEAMLKEMNEVAGQDE
ncbi:MAG: DUF1858 domain-containing protein [Candidatus Diapherotrites archaeon]